MNIFIYALIWSLIVGTIQAYPRRKTFKKLLKANYYGEKISNQEIKTMSLEISSWDFSIILFICCAISFSLLFIVTNKFSDSIIIKSGILIPFWIGITGIIARHFYFSYEITRKWKYTSLLDEKQKNIFWIIIPIIIILVYLPYNFELSLMITAIIIGKFIWLDFAIKLKDIKKSIRQYTETNKILIIIGLKFLIMSLSSGVIVFALQKYF